MLTVSTCMHAVWLAVLQAAHQQGAADHGGRSHDACVGRLARWPGAAHRGELLMLLLAWYARCWSSHALVFYTAAGQRYIMCLTLCAMCVSMSVVIQYNSTVVRCPCSSQGPCS